MKIFEEGFTEIRTESNRIWAYLKDAIDCLENQRYYEEEYDLKELLVYCKSCEDSLERVWELSYELEAEIRRMEYEVEFECIPQDAIPQESSEEAEYESL